jgi:nucleoside-diphosphate kinase
VKPDGVERALIGRIISRFEDAGLKVVAIKMLKPSRELVGRHYVDDKAWLESVGNKTKSSYEAKGIVVKETALEIGQRVRGFLMDYLAGNPVVAMVIEGNEAISVVAKIVGSTAPAKADPSTIRGTYSSDSYALADGNKRSVKNLIHASDSPESAAREIGIWFKSDEIISYKRADEAAIY